MSIPLLIETIRIQDGRVRNIHFHNERCNQSRKSLFGVNKRINLRSYIDTNLATSGLIKCRITYSEEVHRVEYEAYEMKNISSLRLIDIGNYSYQHKYKDRQELTSFYKHRQSNDDILMVKNGLITDSYYANVALKKKGIWYTPKSPLLQGTLRSYLLKKGAIIMKDIPVVDIHQYMQICLFNAMVPFHKILIDINSVNR